MFIWTRFHSHLIQLHIKQVDFEKCPNCILFEVTINQIPLHCTVLHSAAAPSPHSINSAQNTRGKHGYKLSTSSLNRRDFYLSHSNISKLGIIWVHTILVEKNEDHVTFDWLKLKRLSSILHPIWPEKYLLCIDCVDCVVSNCLVVTMCLVIDRSVSSL